MGNQLALQPRIESTQSGVQRYSDGSVGLFINIQLTFVVMLPPELIEIERERLRVEKEMLAEMQEHNRKLDQIYWSQ